MVPRNQGPAFAAALVFLSTFLGLTEAASGNCLVPPGTLPLHEVNVTAEQETLLLTEGRCYLACLREGGVYQVHMFSEFVVALHVSKFCFFLRCVIA